MKRPGSTDAEKRHIVVTDLVIGIGIPALEMVVREFS